jgi:hypothetical protein
VREDYQNRFADISRGMNIRISTTLSTSFLKRSAVRKPPPGLLVMRIRLFIHSRGAQVENFVKFQRDNPQARRIHLETKLSLPLNRFFPALGRDTKQHQSFFATISSRQIRDGCLSRFFTPLTTA